MRINRDGKVWARCGYWLAAALLVVTCGQANAATDSIVAFGGAAIDGSAVDARFAKPLDPAAEHFLVHIPPSYDGSRSFGLIVFMSPDDDVKELPPGWKQTLDREDFLVIAPQQAGNDQNVDRRVAMGVLAAQEMLQHYRVNPTWVYAAGFSGGARMAGLLGFYASSLFRGTIQNCGADFYQPLPQITPRTADDKTGDDYGRCEATPQEIAQAKKNVRFVLITGSRDFRHASIADIYQGGFVAQGFAAKLIDVPGMQHDYCSGQVLASALDFVQSALGESADAVASDTPTGWVQQDPSHWPQLIMSNFIMDAGGGGYGGSAFLLRPDPADAVIGVTAKHCVKDSVNLSNPHGDFSTWTLAMLNNHRRALRISSLATKPDVDSKLDCVLVNVPQSDSYPVKVLSPAQRRIEIGDTVFVAGPTVDPSKTQVICKGKVTQRDPGSTDFYYEIEGHPDTMGFSGAPILDKNGRVIGIHLGHATQGTTRLGYGMDIGAALDATVTTPAPLRPAAVAAAPPVVDKNAKANAALDMAKNYVASGLYDRARDRLQKLIQNYPDTPAATQAKQILQDIADK